MQIRICKPADYQMILGQLGAFWDQPQLQKLQKLHHPMLVHELREGALVLRSRDHIAGYLFGILPRKRDYAYVHLLAVRREDRGKGFGRRLYQAFINHSRKCGFHGLRALTTPDNEASIQFHRHIGFILLGNAINQGHPVIKNYAGPGQDRVVMALAFEDAVSEIA